ncbi:hypothetical protein LL912_00860 [Niabella sp. CC-SYL272]|uniref:hypothetical protein n=1 Tax=Niabella agricola TaxID=2891571 RepID=UPI001F2DC3F0|nr:hypothetical protein [Niabella agricola]MCF3107317.1 hypothetical protein [Niabella agricola]
MLKDKILAALKTKYKDLGLSAKILEGFATRLAKTVTEEEKISEAVDDVEPELQTLQSVIDANRKKVSDLEKDIAALKGVKAEPVPGADPNPSDPQPDPKPKASDETPAWAKALMDSVAALQTERVTTSRRAGYEALFADVKDDDNQAKDMKANKLAGFDRISFKDDEDYNSFLEAEKEFLTKFNQDRDTESLKGGRPPVATTATKGKPDETMLDTVVDDFKI